MRILLGLVLALLAVRADAAGPPVVAAASDLRFALAEIAEDFETATGESVRLSFGSSGNLARQIREDAPFEVFLSADEAYVLDLARDGHTHDKGVLYAIGRIVLAVPHGSPLEADASLADLRAGLADGRVQRFAIANPEHAPYGQRAREALERAGLWEPLQEHLILGENVTQAAQFALSSSSQGGIIAQSLASSPEVAKRGTFALIPADRHAPLRQRMVLLENAGAIAKRFYAYVQEPAARAILRRYGFVLPGEGS